MNVGFGVRDIFPPNVLHKLLIERNAPAVRLKDLWYQLICLRLSRKRGFF